MTTYKYASSFVGATGEGKVRQKAWLGYDITTGDYTYTFTLYGGAYAGNTKWSSINTTCVMTDQASVYRELSGTNLTTEAAKRFWFYSGKTYSVSRTHQQQTKSITVSTKVTGVTSGSGGASINGIWSNVTVTFTIPAKSSWTISYNANGGSDAPSAQTKWRGETLTLSNTRPTRAGWYCSGWATSQARAESKIIDYSIGGQLNYDGALTLYAVWTPTNAPTCDISDLDLTINGTSQTTNDIIRGFTDIDLDISDIDLYGDRSLTSITVKIGSQTATMDGNNHVSLSGFTSADQGSQKILVTTLDSAGATDTYEKGTVNIVAPTWNRDVVISTGEFPSVDKKGYAVLDAVYVWNYKTNQYDSVSKNGHTYLKRETLPPTWAFNYTFDENHVDDPEDLSPTTKVKVEYKYYNVNTPQGSKAFYTTSRNQNYSNGIYNVMFVGGVDNSEFTDYTSRVWWSKINDPLYFPDTNYIEVGSNDTAVQGLTKVGDYLAVVKQSKTTDTAIFLLYPTSFEEETTYAVKQGVQGVGALARYSFNILGDETLFLSPKGVMAIVPTQDEEHKVQNRSYFIDKRLLAESELENAYSFVFDGKYYLAVGGNTAHVYVLDGNKRNSWGNDKTNLVYECYYLENVPANCFVKFKDSLVFSNQNDVCMFSDGYTDAYDDEGIGVPVKAEWSTIFDDDGSLHYYKTMQKKGNLVSILPTENELPYKAVVIDEATFNEDKSLYFILEDGEFVQCTEADVYDADQTYYIENRSNTKIFVKKDGNEPVEIQRKFSLSSDIPSEMFLNKKFKKYKRLQFILQNDADEDFGVDEIVKNYTVGNYAKK